MANNRDLINAFDDCVQRLEAGETLDNILKDYPESADYLRDLLMISEMVYQVHDEDDDLKQAQSRGRDRLQQELIRKEKPKRIIRSTRPRWYLATVAAASFVLLLGVGFLTLTLTNSNSAEIDTTRTSIAVMNTTTEALIRETQTQQLINNYLTQTAVVEANATYDGLPVETLTQAAAHMAMTLDATLNANNGDATIQALMPTIAQPDDFELTATQIIQDATAMDSGIMATPSPYVENFDITATALLMPTITLVSSPIPPTVVPPNQQDMIPTSVASLPQSTSDPNINAVQSAQTTATALAQVFNQTPTIVFGGGGIDGDNNELPDTGSGGNGVDNAIKTTSIPMLSPTSQPTMTGTPTPAPTQTALMTQVADGSVYLTIPAQNTDSQPTPLPALIPLSAGEIDDNAEWDRYLLYRREFLARGFPVYDLDVTGRQIITVLDNDGKPVLGARVRIFANGEAIAETLTYATGQTMFFPNLDERSQGVNEFFVTVEKEGVSQQFMLKRDENATWTITLPVTINRSNVQLDVLFLIDTTSSMADEILQLQNNILHISQQVDTFAGNTDARYGLVLYREFDNFEYVTRRHDFTRDVSEFQTNLNAVTANSGDNNPDWDETLNLALDESLQLMSWRDEDTIKLIFLVADARPHINHPLEPVTYDQSIQEALARGIKIHPIASSGLEQDGEYIFRQIAQVTMGHFLFLTYDNGIPGTSGDTRPEFNVGEPETTDPDGGYTVDRLADVVLRLIQDEVNQYRGLFVP